MRNDSKPTMVSMKTRSELATELSLKSSMKGIGGIVKDIDVNGGPSNNAVGERWSWASMASLEGPRAAAQGIVTSVRFDALMFIVIVANSAVIGLEQSFRIQREDNRSVFYYAENAFIVVYLAELSLRFYALRFRCLKSGWVRFDCVLISVSVLSEWVLIPVLGDSHELGSILVLRTARLLRLGRPMRLLSRFRELGMLVQGLLNSMHTLLHTLALCLVLLYVFGCMSLELLPLSFQDSEVGRDAGAIIDEKFGTLPEAMLTLLQFVTFDNISLIYRPLIQEQFTLVFFFMAVVVIMGVVFMNLVTAIIVNGGLEQAMQDKDLLRTMEEARRKKVLRALREALWRADTDCSGNVSREELEELGSEDKDMLKNILGLDDLVPVFDSLDVDSTGDLAIDDFVAGVESIVMSNTSIEIKRIERMMLSMRKQLAESHRVQDDLRRAVAQISGLTPPPPPDEADRVTETPEFSSSAPGSHVCTETLTCRCPNGAVGARLPAPLVSTEELAWRMEQLQMSLDKACISGLCEPVLPVSRPTTPCILECANMTGLSAAMSALPPQPEEYIADWESLPMRDISYLRDSRPDVTQAPLAAGCSQDSPAGGHPRLEQGACDGRRPTAEVIAALSGGSGKGQAPKDWHAASTQQSAWSIDPDMVPASTKPVLLFPGQSDAPLKQDAPALRRPPLTIRREL